MQFPMSHSKRPFRHQGEGDPAFVHNGELKMTLRLDPSKAAPEALRPMMALEASIKASGLEHSLIELVKTRTSQINGCAYCIHMHTSDARAAGKTEERLYMLSAWWESSF